MPGIFISYRRGRTSAYAGRLYDRLASEFGDENVFMDLTAIDPGADFVERIERAVGEADALLVIIGPDWIEARDGEGRSRLDDPEDFVRREVSGALERETLVVPVLVDGATMPDGKVLPEPLRSLERRNALELTNVGWSRDVDRLIQTLRQRIRGGAKIQSRPRSRQRSVLAVAICFLGLAAAGVFALTRDDANKQRSGTLLEQAADVPVGGYPLYAATTKDKVWVGLEEEGSLKSFRPGSREVSDSPRLGEDLSGLATADERLFVGDYGAAIDDGRGKVLEVNPATARSIGRPLMTTDPYEVATDGRSLWVTDSLTVQAINLETRAVHRVAFDGAAFSLAVDDGKAWVVDNEKGRLHSYNAQSGRTLRPPIDVGARPFGLAVGGGFVWVALDGGNLVRVPVNGGARRLLTVGGEGRHVVAADERNVWVVDEQGNVVLVDARSFKIRGRIRLKGDLQDVAVAGDSAWVTRSRSKVASSMVRVVLDPAT